MRSTVLYSTARAAGYTIAVFKPLHGCTPDESAMYLSFKSSRYAVNRCYRVVRQDGEAMPFVFWLPYYSRNKVVLSVAGKVRAFSLDKNRGQMTWQDLEKLFSGLMEDLSQPKLF